MNALRKGLNTKMQQIFFFFKCDNSVWQKQTNKKAGKKKQITERQIQRKQT